MASKVGPSLEVQLAVFTAISADAAIQALIGNPPRVNPDQTTNWPGSYITIGDGQSIPDLAECIDGREIFTDIHIWSRADKSFANAKKIAATIWDCLKNAVPTLTENRIMPVEGDDQFFEWIGEQLLRDPDGKTLHIVLTVRALTEPAA